MRKRNFLIIFLSAAVFVLSGCADKLKSFEVTSVAVESITPQGFRGLSADLAVGVDNPLGRIEVSDISGNLYISGKIIGKLTMAPFVLSPRSEASYDLKAELALDESVNLMSVMALATSKKAVDDATVDVYARIKVKGMAAKKIQYEKIPLKKLLEFLK